MSRADSIRCILNSTALSRLYEGRAAWLTMQKRGMEQDFTWKASCEKYVEVYKEALARGCGINNQ